MNAERTTGTRWGGFIQMLSCVALSSGESAPTGIISRRCRCVRDAGCARCRAGFLEVVCGWHRC
ncbi:MAG: hypothetical protein KME26_29535 [Oscillatoria princeps RMCB-10]|nr:hypothetical protein [Oscillatoria princeps RMCB-10]